MPTYSYRCTECDNAFDIQQAFTDDSLTVCPVCGGKLRKVYGAVGVTFNGSGFYRNDSRATKTSTDGPKKSSGEGGGSSSSSSSESSSSSSSSSDSKPASAPAKPASAPGAAA
ncbi:FmdB family transcriptional regulator [Subtercola boreus]|uniref:FmdB family transcriptional regulator n=1 Tax=Subtercola boreus TaxID=120213 RepID=A0A3E0VVL5_9MICO|nr:FmdB family zinc ribbon protein [Subtercola boreus]RFA13821.1 FmdB family transcriptional regulator [Subtercola boreus]